MFSPLVFYITLLFPYLRKLGRILPSFPLIKDNKYIKTQITRVKFLAFEFQELKPWPKTKDVEEL